jgi:predicted DNA-binding protein (UPF0251 family)
MPRPRLPRNIGQEPNVTYYKPRGIPLRGLAAVETSHEEWEALRLKYSLHLNQTTSAKRMQTSQSTLQRILSSAQGKLGRAVVEGKAIKILK